MVKMTKRKTRQVSVTMKQNKDGTITMRSYGGFDLRKVLNPPSEPPTPALQSKEAGE